MRRKQDQIPWMTATLIALLSSGCVVAPELNINTETQEHDTNESTAETATTRASQFCQASPASAIATARRDRKALNDALATIKREAWRLGSDVWQPLIGPPVYSEGDMVGLRVTGLRRGDYLNLLGLENGDVVVAANGHQLESMHRVAAAWADVRKGGDLMLVIERDGRHHVFNTRVGS